MVPLRGMSKGAERSGGRAGDLLRRLSASVWRLSRRSAASAASFGVIFEGGEDR